jgi:hypothetical protein
MNFADFRKKNKASAPVTPETSEPANSTVHSGEAEKEHQNKDLLKMKDDAGNKTVWIPRGPKIKAPGLTTESHHKVKIHFGNGKSETRIIDDEELGVLKRNNHITKVTHLGRSKLNGELLEYVLEEGDGAEVVFKHKDGRVAHLQSHKYKDPSLGTDHYVHLPDSRATVYPGEEGLAKAHKLLSKLGYEQAK